MRRTILAYGLAFAGAAFALAWLQYKFYARAFAGEIYVLIIAAAFTLLGAWAGRRLTPQKANRPFERNEAAISSLGITAREYESLTRLAAGEANKEIARAMGVTPNTVKSHLASLYRKLGAVRRTDAIARARELGLLP